MIQNLPLAELFALFRSSPAFKRVFLADLASQLGDGGLLIAFPLLILHQTHDVTLTGLAFSGEILAVGLMSPFAGEMADRLEQKTLMMAANLARATLLGCLLLTLASGGGMVLCIGLSVLLGCASAFFHPARAAFLRRLLEGEALDQAIALEGTVQFLMRIVAPAAMGVLVALYPPTLAIWVAIGTYVAAVLLLSPTWVTGPRVISLAVREPGAWREGWRLIGNSARLREMLVLDVILTVAGMAAYSLTVAWLELGLHRPATDNGWLLATTGLAGAVGTQVAGRLGRGRSRYAALTGLTAMTYLLVPVMPGLGALMGVWAMRGFSNGVLGVMFNQTLVRETPPALMGRVHAAWGLAGCLAAFVGSATTPLLLRTLGPAGAYVLYGSLLTLTALTLAYFATRTLVQPAPERA